MKILFLIPLMILILITSTPSFAVERFSDGSPNSCSLEPTKSTLDECYRINQGEHKKATNCGDGTHAHKGLSVCTNKGVNGTPNTNPNNNCGLGTLEDSNGKCQLFPGDCDKHIAHDKNGIPYIDVCPSFFVPVIPDWVKTILFTFYRDGQISDRELYNATEFLIQKEIIRM